MWIEGNSSNIHSFRWQVNDPDAHQFQVRFKDRAGNVTAEWKYDAPHSKFTGMQSADSRGKYFNAEIKNVYHGIKVA